MEKGKKKEALTEGKSMRKIAVLFPGIGYHKDKPLLYYSMRIAREAGYQAEYVDFSGISWDKGDLKDPVRMKELFTQAMELVRKKLDGLAFKETDELVFISKSIGTVVAACYASGLQLAVKHIYFSPVAAFGEFAGKGGIAFYGDRDPLAEAREIEAICKEKAIAAYKIAGGNHSLEVGNTATDIEVLEDIMDKVRGYIYGGIYH